MTPEMLKAGLPPANDRMLTTFFLAALLHAIVILGVTFSAPGGGAKDGVPTLEVVLINDQAPGAAQNPTASYLAERNQNGSGNAAADAHALIPRSSPVPVDRAGQGTGEAVAFGPAALAAGEETMAATTGTVPRILYFGAPAPAKDPPERPLLLENRPDLGLNPNDEGTELRLRGASTPQLWAAADTRESDVAVYLDGWRRKVERVGTVNFPSAARSRQLSGTPVVEVTIGADGHLEQATILTGSGHPEIDDAAIRILKLAAPFEPFPGELKRHHTEIRVAYEWRFLDGAAQGSNVLYSVPGGPPAEAPRSPAAPTLDAQ